MEVCSITDHSSESIIEEILKIYSSIKDLEDEEILQDTSDHLKNVYQRLDDLITLPIDYEAAEAILNGHGFDQALDTIIRFIYLYTIRLETEYANSILTSNEPWEMLKIYSFYPNYCQLVRTEYQGAGLKANDTVVFLGSGPLPMTLILMCHQHGLKGIGIEQDEQRAELSRKVVDKLGLSNAIKIIHGNHFQLPLSEGADLIMIAAQAQPKKEIIEQLAKALPAGTKISCRIYEKGLRRLLDRSILVGLPAKLAHEFKECCRIHPLPPVYNTVVFAVRSSAAAPERP
ncbi:nicotianamine synthase family protein [Methanococcoides sp. NM1]|uniref:nicotianamine synthase family protein n=1 Tax=Methanococcoides sp. NM1 TaxID=1201013 RepID=UPI001FCEC5BA|nr:nicotianamine synthase family protein [Methanococcoides sp. NM1]